MKIFCVLAGLLLSVAPAPAPTLAWDAYPAPGNIAGIRIYSGPNLNPALGGGSVVATLAPTAVGVTLSNLPPGVLHFQATAFSSSGAESLPSNDAGYTNVFVGPTNLRVGP
jgi:hypothetical protein